MHIPIEKNRRWIAGLHEGIDQLGRNSIKELMKPSGNNCASDLWQLCEEHSGKPIDTVEELVNGWNILREKRNLSGKWEFERSIIRGIFGECGCLLVNSGLIELHPVQCYCSQQMIETIFSQGVKRKVEVDIKRSIGRGDGVCEFLIEI